MECGCISHTKGLIWAHRQLKGKFSNEIYEKFLHTRKKQWPNVIFHQFFFFKLKFLFYVIAIQTMSLKTKGNYINANLIIRQRGIKRDETFFSLFNFHFASFLLITDYLYIANLKKKQLCLKNCTFSEYSKYFRQWQQNEQKMGKNLFIASSLPFFRNKTFIIFRKADFSCQSPLKSEGNNINRKGLRLLVSMDGRIEP